MTPYRPEASCSLSPATQDLHLFKHIKTDEKIGIGVINHCNTVVEPAEHVASLIRNALEYIPQGAARHQH